MMDCEEIRPNLLAYLDGEVSDAERAQIDAHLAACPDCAAELERLRALQADLWDAVPLGWEQLHLPRPAEERIRARLRRARERRRPLDGLAGLLRPRPGLIKAAIPLIAALFLVVAGLVGRQPVPVSAQETIVVGPTTLAPDTDAALRVIVREHASAQPISDAQVRIRLQAQGQQEVLLYSGRTSSQGTADVRFHVPPYEEDRLSADLVVTAISPLGEDEVKRQVVLERSFRLYLTSDKPLYRPRQAIHLRALVVDAAQRLPAAGRQLGFTVQGPDGERLLQTTVRTSEYGIAAADYVLSPSAPHGRYRLVAALGDTLSERTVTVGQYERPRFRVQLDLARPYYLAGEVVEGQVTARTFGEDPLPGATVTLRAYLHDPGRRLVATVQGRTDGDGAFAFHFGLPSDLRAEQANLAVEAAMSDQEGHLEWAGRLIPVAAEALAVDVVAEGGRLRPGVENRVYVLVATPDGAPVRAHLDVGVAGHRYELVTDEYGLAAFGLAPDPGVREVQVQIAASDAQGRTVARTVALSADRGPAQVLLRLDRAAYEVGETMHLEILAGQGETVYVDVVQRNQGQTVSTHAVTLHDGRAALDLDVSPQMVGTLELHAYQVLPDGALARDARLAVVDAPVQVSVDVRTDKPAYRPGDVARVAIDTSLEGRPVQGALGIAVVDESLFALEERAPGFAKLFFLLEKSLLEPATRPQGFALGELLDPLEVAEVRAAQDQAARAAWARLPTGDLALERSAPAAALAAAQAQALARLRRLGWGLGGALLAIPLALWAAVVRRLRRAGSWNAALRRTALLLIGLAVVVLVPLTALLSLGLSLVLGEMLAKALLIVLLAVWLATLVAWGVYAWRRRDDGVQIAVLLVAAYGVLGALMGYVAERGGDPGRGLVLGAAVAFVAALAALLLLAAGFWVEGRRAAAGLTLALVLLSVALAVFAGAALSTSSLFARTMADPRAYTGPVGWLAGCAPQAKKEAAVEATSEPTRETVVVEREVVKEVVKEVEKEVQIEATEVVEVEKIVTPAPAVQPTPTPVGPPPPAPSPTVPAAAQATRVPELPPPLLGQFVPETIYWAPEALTDAAGHLQLEIPLPNVPATWRLTALASTRNGELGSTMAILQAGP